MNRLISQLIFLLLLLITSCTSISSGSFTDNGGGATETVGIVYNTEGSAVPNVNVLFIPHGYSPNSGSSLIDTTITDENGKFNFSTISNGKYNLIFEKDSLKAFRSNLEIINKAITSSIKDTIKATASISGVAQLLPKHNNREIYVMVLGSNIYSSPIDSIGNFKIDNVAEGEYVLRFMTSYNNYEVLDTSIVIKSQENLILLDTILLPFIGIDIPTGLSAEYNSNLKEALISWNSVGNSTLDGYQLLRRISGTVDYSIVNRSVLRDTFFMEVSDGDLINEGSEWEYAVAGIDNDGLRGKSSKPIKITYKSLYTSKILLSSSSFVKNLKGAMAKGIDGYLYYISSSSGEIKRFDFKSNRVIKTIEIPGNGIPSDIKCLADFTIMVVTNRGVYNLDKNGKQLYWYNINSGNIDVDSLRYIYYSESVDFYDGENAICRFDSYRGVRDTIFISKDSTIVSFDYNSDNLFVLLKKFNNISVSKINCSTKLHKELFSREINCIKGDIEFSDNSISILLNGEVYSIGNKKIKYRFSVGKETLRFLANSSNSFITLNDYEELKVYSK